MSQKQLQILGILDLVSGIFTQTHFISQIKINLYHFYHINIIIMINIYSMHMHLHSGVLRFTEGRELADPQPFSPPGGRQKTHKYTIAHDVLFVVSYIQKKMFHMCIFNHQLVCLYFHRFSQAFYADTCSCWGDVRQPLWQLLCACE